MEHRVRLKFHVSNLIWYVRFNCFKNTSLRLVYNVVKRLWKYLTFVNHDVNVREITAELDIPREPVIFISMVLVKFSSKAVP